jgi:hypothetical protein
MSFAGFSAVRAESGWLATTSLGASRLPVGAESVVCVKGSNQTTSRQPTASRHEILRGGVEPGFKIDRPSLLANPVKNELPVIVDMIWKHSSNVP